MSEAPYRLRVAALMGFAALGVHEGRYLLAYGSRSGEQLAAQGHGYLPLMTAAAVALLALAGVQLLATLTRGRRWGAQDTAPPAGWKLWLAASAALIAMHSGQELLEGALSPGHAHGAAAVFANGGWACVPLALGFGALVALLLCGAELAVRAAAGGCPPRAPYARLSLPLPRTPRFIRTSSPLAAKLAGRAPPLAA